MNQKKIFIFGAAAAVLVLVAVIVGLVLNMRAQQAESDKMIEVLEMDKREMENEYEQFAMQYNEMMAQINNDSLEQQKTEALLEELRQTKAQDAAEIMRLKKELATLREVLRSYILQIDSLNRENQELKVTNSNLETQNRQAQAHISNLSSQNEALSDKVAIAAQLDATGIYARANNKRGKEAKKVKDAKKIVVGFYISRTATTETGIRTLYVRILTPTGAVLTKGGTFEFENRQIEYSIRKDIEYTGEEQSVTVYWDIAETLPAGQYRADIFADGHNIGNTSFELK